MVRIVSVRDTALRCPYCLDSFEGGDPAVACDRCHTTVHRECWSLNDGCPTFLCRGRIALSEVPWLTWGGPCLEGVPVPNVSWGWDRHRVGQFQAWWKRRKVNREPPELTRCIALVLNVETLIERFSRIRVDRNAATDWNDALPDFQPRQDSRLIEGSQHRASCLSCNGMGSVIPSLGLEDGPSQAVTCRRCDGVGQRDYWLADNRSFEIQSTALPLLPQLGEPMDSLLCEWLVYADFAFPLPCQVDPWSLPEPPAGWRWVGGPEQISEALQRIGERYDVAMRRLRAFAVPILWARWSGDTQLLIADGLDPCRIAWI